MSDNWDHNAPGGPQREGARLGAAAALLAGSILLSRLLGYLRDVVLADRVGAGAQADAYYAAFQIPDLLNYLLAGGALAIAFIPLYSRTREARGQQAAERLFACVLGNVGLAALVTTGLLWFYAEALISLQFPDFDAETKALTVRLTRIVLPAQIFFLTGGIVRAVLMAHGRFGAQAAAPLLYNLAVIAGGLAAGTPEGFAWGVLVGSVLGPFVVPLLDLARMRTLRLRVRLAFDPDFKKYLWVALPLMLGLSLATVDEWYERWFGATLAVGTVAHLSFARKLMMAPVAVVGQAVAAAALPSLARLFAAGEREALNRTLLQTLRVSLVLAVLSGTACAVLAGPLVEFVYRHGRFGQQDAVAVASILFVLAFAVPAWVTQQIAVRAFYARGDTWRPMILATGVALAAIPLYLALTRTHGAPGIALAGVLAMTVNAVATLVWGARRFDGPALAPLFGSGLRALGIGLVAGLAAGFAQPQIAPGWEGALLDLAVGGSVFLAVSGMGCWWWGDDAMRTGIAAIGARLRRGYRRRTLK